MTISRKPGSISEKQAAVSLLFSAGSRPRAEAIRDYLDASKDVTVSLLPAADETGRSGEVQWLELLSSGLTFDMVCLAPGPRADLPERKGDRLARGGGRLEGFEAVTIIPGPHLAGASRMLPVLRTLATVAAAFADYPGLEAIAWHAARTWSEPDIFGKGVANWIEGGVFPGLILASVSLAPDKGLHSEGMALFTGQELRIEPDLAADLPAATRLALRLFDYLVGREPVTKAESLTGPDGKPLKLQPSANGRFVRVARG